MEHPPRHSCLSLPSRLLCASFPCGPWRCEGHSPWVSLPPQAQDPSTGCSWTASSYDSAPGARRGEGGDGVMSKTRGDRLHFRPQDELESLEGSKGTIPTPRQWDNPHSNTIHNWAGPTLTSHPPTQDPAHTVLVPAAVGILPHWLTVPVLTPSPLPPENWKGRA